MSKKLNVLDLGSKIPWISHQFSLMGFNSYAVDGIPEILEFTKNHNLKCNSFQYDFESDSPYPWGDIQFSILTCIHIVEHFYHPLRTFEKIASLLASDGLLFIRCPDYEVSGIQNHMSEEHYTIHPQVWNLKSMQIALSKVGLKIEKTSVMEGAGQRDYYVRHANYTKTPEQDMIACYKKYGQELMQLKTDISIGAGLIVKNEEHDLPECLDSIKEQVDYIVIGDTGSTDNTRIVIADWCASNGWDHIIYAPDCPLGGYNDLPTNKKSLIFTEYLEASELENDDWKLWDFSKARNYVISIAEKLNITHFFNLDADDILQTNINLKELVKTNFNMVIGFGIVSNFENLQGRFIHHRLWPVNRGIKYVGKVHEYPHFNLPCVNTDFNIRHKYHDPVKNLKQESSIPRNLRILKKEYDNGVRDTRTLFYYGNSLRENGQHEEAVKVYEEYLDISGVRGNKPKITKDFLEKLFGREGIDKTWNLTVDQLIAEILKGE